MKQDKKEEDFYINEDGFVVFTSKFLLRRGFCCENNCKHCPYEELKEIEMEKC